MDISKYKRIWQHASGDTNRSYHELSFKWGVILFGPGYKGPWPDCKEPLRKAGWSSRKMTTLDRFANEMQDGDLVVLRLGTDSIYGVGEIVGDYIYEDCFGDVDGWDLQHTRRVRWLWVYENEPKRFNTYALKFGDTTQELTGEEVLEWLRELEVPAERYQQPLPDLPKVGNKVSLDVVTEYLFAEGISNNSIERLQSQIMELRRIANWYYKEKHHPSEYETIAYLVAPLLRAIGWTPQQVGIEWNKVDLALFSSLPREDQKLSVVVEAKKMDYSCLTAKSQASGYAQGKENCHRLIVTEGMRYGVYLKENGEFILKAYFNLLDLRDSYPIYNCSGVREALTLMAPEWQPETKQND